MFSFILSTSPHKPLSQPCINGYIFQNGPQCCASPYLCKCSSSAWNVILSLIPLSSVQFSCSVVSNSLWPHGLQHARLPCPSPTPGACSNSYPLSYWCHPTISSSVIPFSCLQSFLMSQFFITGGQGSGASASESVLPINIQYWFLLGLTCLISLLSKGLSRIFSNSTVQKHQFFSGQLSFWSNSHINTGKAIVLTYAPLLAK